MSKTYEIAAKRLLAVNDEAQSRELYGIGVREFVDRTFELCRKHIGNPIESGKALSKLHGGLRIDESGSLDYQKLVDHMHSFIIVGLNGKIGSGKDTLADFLVKDRGFVKTSFADPLRAFASAVYDIPMEMFLDRNLKEKPLSDAKWDGLEMHPVSGNRMTPRNVLQLIGTECIRATVPDFWVKRAAVYIAQAHQYTQSNCFVMPDVRFQNEAKGILEWGGSIYEIRRPDHSHKDDASQKHASEAGLGLISRHLIYNAGSLEDLRREAILLHKQEVASREEKSDPSKKGDDLSSNKSKNRAIRL